MAITERYVTSAATGGYTGSTNPLTPATLTVAFTLGTAGDRWNIKNDGTYNRSAGDAPPAVGTLDNPLMYRGYNTVIGDAEQGRSAGDGNLITSNMPLIDYGALGVLSIGASPNVVCSGLNITTAYPFNPAVGTGTNTTFFNCKIANTSSALGGTTIRSGGGAATFINCDISSAYSAEYAVNSASGIYLIACKITAGPGMGVYVNSGGVISDCLVYSCGTGGIYCNDQYAAVGIYNCTIVGCTGDGIRFNANVYPLAVVANCHITDNTEWGIRSLGTGPRVFTNNRFRDNGSGAVTGPAADNWALGAIFKSLTTDSGTGASDYATDYSLLSTAVGVTAGLGFKRTIGAWGPPYATAGSTASSGGLKSYGSA